MALLETKSQRQREALVGDKAAAQVVASQIRAKLQLGEFEFDPERTPSMPTFKLYADSFMDTYSAMNHKGSTRDTYRAALGLNLIPFFGEMTLDYIKKKDVKDFIKSLHQEGLSPGTERNQKAYLSAILSEAVDDELIGSNPASMTGKYIKKKDSKEEINPFTWEEKTKFEDAMKEHYPRYYPFFLTQMARARGLFENSPLNKGATGSKTTSPGKVQSG